MSSLVLVNGEEDFLMERAARDEVSSSLIEEVNEYKLPSGLEEYLYDSQTPLFSGSSRAFILWEVNEIPKLPEGSDLLICVAKSSKKPLSDKRAKRVHNFPKLKSYDDNNEVIKWILREGERLNIDLSRVATALFVNCGNSLRKISSEINKIAVLTPQGSIVSPNDARGVMCFSAELNPSQIIEAICDGNTTKALAFYDKLQEANDETGWIIAFLQRHVLQQLKLELLLEKKFSDSEISEKLGIHPYTYKKVFQKRRNLWTKSSLLNSVNTLCDLDISHKIGESSARFGLELEIIKMSEEAKSHAK